MNQPEFKFVVKLIKSGSVAILSHTEAAHFVSLVPRIMPDLKFYFKVSGGGVSVSQELKRTTTKPFYTRRKLEKIAYFKGAKHVR